MNDNEKSYIERASDALSKPFFFIAGTERSGTTWLQLLMDAHPEIACRGEGHFIDDLFPKLDEVFDYYRDRVARFNQSYFKSTKGFPLMTPALAMELKRVVVGGLFAQFDPGGNSRIYGEKTPGNIRNLDYLNDLFPDARFLFIIRDGRDVAVSLWHHGRRADAERPPLEGLATGLAKSWRRDIMRTREFAEKHPGMTHTVRYEDLHAEPVAALSGIFRFLGVADDAETATACAEDADFSKFSGGRARGEEDKANQFRKGVVGDWRNYDDADVDAIFKEHAADVMAELGYE